MSDMADYSWWGGDVATLPVAGVSLYLTHDTTGKAATAARIAGAHACGKWVQLNFEDSPTNWQGGYAQGYRDGTFARQMAQALGYPAGSGIPASIDSDVTPGQMGTAMSYLDGFRAGLAGAYTVGVYGSFAVCQAALAAGGHAAYAWQTLAWSHGLVLTGALLYQDGRQAAGGNVDLNQVRAAVGGLVWWPSGVTPDSNTVQILTTEGNTDMGLTPDEDAALGRIDQRDANTEKWEQNAGNQLRDIWQWSADVRGFAIGADQALNDPTNGLLVRVAQTQATLAALPAQIAAAVTAAQTGAPAAAGLTADQLTAAVEAGARRALTGATITPTGGGTQ